MKFSYGLLQELVSDTLPEPHTLADMLSLHSYECERVFKQGDDTILDLDILPNRASDSAGHSGVARDSAALLGCAMKPIEAEKIPFHDSSLVEIMDSACDRYSAVLIEGITVQESPQWLVDRLGALGLNSINTIVDITNYVMLITGQPLHAFDYDRIADDSKKIIVRKAKKGEKIHGLDDNEYALDESMLVIADSEKLLGIAGIKGGVSAMIDESTKNIIIESAHFDPLSIRRSAQVLKLSTDASWRFERNVPPCFTTPALEMAAHYIQEMGGGKVYEGVDIDRSHTHKPSIRFNAVDVDTILGVSIPRKNISDILTSLEFSVREEGDDFVVVPPEFRLDVATKYDVYEEIARMTGYEKIPAVVPSGFISSPVHNNDTRSWKRRITQEIVSYGFFEIHTVSFVKKEWVELFGMTSENVWELENPIQDSLPFLRPSLIPQCAIVASRNTQYANGRVRMFEIGHGFLKQGGKNHEEELVTLVIANTNNDPETFYEVKGAIRSLCDSMGIGSDIAFNPLGATAEGQCQIPLFHPLQSAHISINNEMIGALGIVADSGKNALGIKGNGTIVACEVRLGALLANARSERVYQPVSKYPSIVRDISLFVPINTRVADIENILWNATGDVLYDVDMFDYRPMAQDNVLSIAFHLVFQSKERTLLSQEIDEQMEAATQAIQQNSRWEVRQ